MFLKNYVLMTTHHLQYRKLRRRFKLLRFRLEKNIQSWTGFEHMSLRLTSEVLNKKAMKPLHVESRSMWPYAKADKARLSNEHFNLFLAKFIRNYIRDRSGVFSTSSLMRILMTSFHEDIDDIIS